MINPVTLVNSLVTQLQAIPALVTAMGEDSSRIYAYHDSYPNNTSFEKALYELKSPGVLVTYAGLISKGGMDPWQHKVSLSLRAPVEDSDEESPIDYHALFSIIWNGKEDPSDADEQPMKYKVINASCYPMELESFLRQTDAAGIDFFEIVFSFTEIGDE